MKIGSLIELIDDNWDEENRTKVIPFGVVYPVKNKVYTIREFDDDVALRLEEIVNPVLPFKDGPCETSFYIKRFRELQPPMKISIEQFNQQPEFA